MGLAMGQNFLNSILSSLRLGLLRSTIIGVLLSLSTGCVTSEKAAQTTTTPQLFSYGQYRLGITVSQNGKEESFQGLAEYDQNRIKFALGNELGISILRSDDDYFSDLKIQSLLPSDDQKISQAKKILKLLRLIFPHPKMTDDFVISLVADEPEVRKKYLVRASFYSLDLEFDQWNAGFPHRVQMTSDAMKIQFDIKALSNVAVD